MTRQQDRRMRHLTLALDAAKSAEAALEEIEGTDLERRTTEVLRDMIDGQIKQLQARIDADEAGEDLDMAGKREFATSRGV